MNVTAIGGKMYFRHLTLELLKNDKNDYTVRKVIAWNKMMDDCMRPTKWLKPNKNGTAVHFEFITREADNEMAYDEFKKFLSEITNLFDLGVEKS